MKLGTINAFLNIFLLCLVVEINDDYTRLFISTIFKHGYIVNWWGIAGLEEGKPLC